MKLFLCYSPFQTAQARSLTTCALLFCWLFQTHIAVGNTVEVDLLINPQAAGIKVPLDFLGLGYETAAVAQPNFFGVQNLKMVQLYRTLTSHGVVRIGGNVSDHTRYVPDGTAAAHSEREVTVVNQANLRSLGEFLRVTGWKAIWGLNLGTGPKEEASNEAIAVDQALGTQLHSFEIGNEVDLLPRFARRYDAYHLAYSEYKSAIRAVLPQAMFSGPDVAWNLDWCLKFAATESGDLRFITQHYYRAGANKPEATVETLLKPDDGWNRILSGLRNACESKPISYRICEVNSFYGGGKPGVSDTFASTLWCLDYLFQLASAGCGGVNMETDVNQLGWISHYSPIVRGTDGDFITKPEYYGLLAFSLAGTGELVKLTQSSGTQINLCAYATRSDQGQLWVTIINKDLEKDSEVRIMIPGRWSAAQRYPLCAPAVESNGEVTLAGAAVSAEGKWTPQPQVQSASHDGIWSVTVPHASAMLVQIQR